MVKIAFLINSMAGGGAERVMSILLKNLSRKDRKIFLILLENEVYYDIPEDVEIIKLNSKYFGFLKLKRIIKEKEINLVFSFLNRSNYTNVLAKKAGHKIYLSERINPSQMHKKGLKGLINRSLTKKLYPEADLILANSLGGRNSLINDFSINPHKIKVIYNPINFEEIQSLSQKPLESEYENIFKYPTIINVGRLGKEKGQESLIQAFNEVKKEIPEAKLIILGEGKLARKFKKLIRRLGLEADVFLLGWQKNPFKFIKNSRVFVLSSLWEGLPNTLIEAMACRVPVISTDCPSGPDEIIDDNENGILVPLNDVKNLAFEIKKVLKNPTLADRLSINAKKRAQDFSIDNIKNQYEELI